MINTKEKYPFWITHPDDIKDILSGIKRGKIHTLCTSAGGYSIPYVTYGEKEDYERRANYSSACGGRDTACYANKEGKRPTIMLIGATHGQETEGVAAISNLISLLESGKDLRGEEFSMLTDSFEKTSPRLVIIPVYNMDGRMRCLPDSMIGEPFEGLRYHGQGTWKDGTLCGWPECKKVHPIKDAAGFLGAYYNDDGVNLMHDNFFAPMAQETRALMKLVDEEAPDCVIGLHGGGNSVNFLMQPDYVPLYIKKGVLNLAQSTASLESSFGYKTHVSKIKETCEGFPPPSFNLTTAIHHICGGVSSTYESNEGLADTDPIAGSASFTAEEILIRHYCLFTSLFRCAWKD